MGNHDAARQRDAWNREYRERGPLYGGAPFTLPDLPQGAIVLDLGCGNGKHLPAMEARGWRVVGIDSAEEAVQSCTGPGRECFPGDAAALPFKEQSFSAVIGIHILGHLTQTLHPVLIENAHRVLQPGGILYLTIFSRQDMRCGKGDEVEPWTYSRRGIITHYFSEDELRSLTGPFGALDITTCSYTVRYRGSQHLREHFVCTFRR